MSMRSNDALISGYGDVGTPDRSGKSAPVNPVGAARRVPVVEGAHLAAAHQWCRVPGDALRGGAGGLEILGEAVPGAGGATLTMKRPAGTGVIAGPGPPGVSGGPAGRRRVVMDPQDPSAGWAAGGGHLRASDAEREQVIDALKAAFVQGRLSRSELARRAGQALESRTYAELAGATAGIAAGPAPTAPPHPPAAPERARPVNRKVIAWAVSVIIVSPALGVAFFATYWGSFFILLLLAYVAAGVTGTPGPP